MDVLSFAGDLLAVLAFVIIIGTLGPVLPDLVAFLKDD